jgi:hypothetical protein
MRILTCVLLCVSVFAHAQTKVKKYDLIKMMNDGKLTLCTNCKAEAITIHEKEAFQLTVSGGNGFAWLTGETFTNGTIEFDLKGKDMLQQSFIGIAFHAIDEKQFDVVYFRPFNFRAEDPVRKIHAVQYASGPDYGWERLRKEHNGQYEKEITPAPDPNEWFHAKIVVDAPHISVYVNGNSKPSLVVDQLQTRGTGKIGLWQDGPMPADFANLTITPK